MNIAGDASPRIEFAAASDGARIACKRKPADGPPVIFFHGLAVNADLWDIPDIDLGGGRTFRSLPALLHDRGFDVWLANFRGHGAPHMLSEAPAGQTDWCVDHFVLFDAKAVVERVIAATHRRPIIVANSMGAMVTAAYLQGATQVGYGEFHSITADEVYARKRQDAVAGAVLVEMPATLRWPKSLYDEQGKLRWSELLSGWVRAGGDVNYPFEWLSRAGWVEAILAAAGEIRLDWLRPTSSGWRSLVPVQLLDRFGLTDKALTAGLKLFSERIKGARHFHADMFMRGLLHAVDHMKAGVLKQLAQCVRRGAFVSALGEPVHSYSDSYDLITLPTFAIGGDLDRIASASELRTAFFERIRSTDKMLRIHAGLAHGEFEYAPAATEQFYPEVIEWIERRAG